MSTVKEGGVAKKTQRIDNTRRPILSHVTLYPIADIWIDGGTVAGESDVGVSLAWTWT